MKVSMELFSFAQAVRFNGGPGCSSMIGLFQENGPCQFYNGSNEPSLNPYSFNTHVNMLYVDQPISKFSEKTRLQASLISSLDVGFSYGTDTVDSTYVRDLV